MDWFQKGQKDAQDIKGGETNFPSWQAKEKYYGGYNS